MAHGFGGRRSQAAGVCMTMLHRRVKNVLIGFHDKTDPTNQEWNAWLDASVVAANDGVVCLIKTLGGTPTAKQRAEIKARLGVTKLKTAVLIASGISRGAVTAISWLGVPVRAYDLHELAKAKEYLGLSTEDVIEAERVLKELGDEIKMGQVG